MDKEIVICHGKLNAQRNAVNCFLYQNNTETNVSSGMLDKNMKLCSDICGIIQSFKVNIIKVEDGKDDFFIKQ